MLECQGFGENKMREEKGEPFPISKYRCIHGKKEEFIALDGVRCGQCFMDECGRLRKEIDRLKAENEKLKSINPDCGGTHVLESELFKQRFSIGKYRISETNDRIWIEHDSGERMEVKPDALEKLIHEFWMINF